MAKKLARVGATEFLLDNLLQRTTFIEDIPPLLTCLVCRKILKHPLQLSCGHRVCKLCNEEGIPTNDNGTRSCPDDNDVIEWVFPDGSALTEIMDLKCYCVANDDGCDWEGCVLELEVHFRGCKFCIKSARKEKTSQVRHNAPAGQTYPSIQDAGRSTLEAYCDNYPHTTSSILLPNLFLTSFPEIIDNPQVTLTDKKKRQFDGFLNNLAGEREEYEIYLAFTSLARRSHAHPLLVIWGLKFDSDNSRAIKRNVLINELPSINLGPGEMSQEKDFIIFVRDCGVVFGEVKRSATQVNIDKAEEQLENANNFFQKMMFAISGPSRSVLPTSKLILIPNENGTSPAARTSSGCHFLYNDMVQNFNMKWEEIVEELKTANATNPISSSDFERLVQIVTGIWSMKPFQRRFFLFNDNQASFPSNIQEVDKRINTAFLCSEKGAPFSSNVPTPSTTEAFRCDEEINVLYFSPQQKLIFDEYPHALIRAHAGCGKTLLILIKIVDILEKDPTQKILLIAPYPHHHRCRNILQRNAVVAEIFESFPTSLSPSCQVVIVELQNFFKVPRDTLLTYNLSLFNILVDDLHGYKVPRKGDHSDFTDAGDFVEYAYSVSKSNNHLCWFALDSAQQIHARYADKNSTVAALFLTKSGTERNFNIPVVVMNQILRNSKEIVSLLQSAREIQTNLWGLFFFPKMIANIECGHHITSQKVIYHRLEMKLQDEIPTPTIRRFVCERVEELLRTLSSSGFSSSFFSSFSSSLSSSTSSSFSPHSFDFSSVAILFDNEVILSYFNKELQKMLSRLGLSLRTIEAHLDIDAGINSDRAHVVIDHNDNIQSFETAVLVFVRYGGGGAYTLYNVVSRARTICTIINVGPRASNRGPLSSFLSLQNIDLVEWKELNNGVFTKLD